ncbi:MAG: SUF system NifU family Fe-S cluster assembly protein [Verrucomicrobiota bacterium]
MNADFEELYQQVILDHSKRPRNYGTLEGDAIHVDGDNPSCGDEIHLHVRFGTEGEIEDVKFTGVGCAISQASASPMTLKLKGKSRADSQAMLEAFTDVVTTGVQEPPKMLGDLRLLSGVQKFPQRVKCAMLAWRAFEQAMHQGQPGTAVEAREEGPHCP